MRRIIILSLLGLTMLGGVATADRYRDHHRPRVEYRQRYQHARPVHRSNNWYRPSYRNTYTYTYRSRPAVGVVRRPIYVQRPVIAYRYYNYYQRPAPIAENYAPMTGYYWVPGSWQWNGYEWIWQPGHYQPDPAYTGQYYDNGYYNY